MSTDWSNPEPLSRPLELNLDYRYYLEIELISLSKMRILPFYVGSQFKVFNNNFWQ
jgi:hypothetical protein